MIATEKPVANGINESVTFLGHHKLSFLTVHKAIELKREKYLENNLSQVNLLEFPEITFCKS